MPQRKIKIGKATVGLIGLEQALQEALGRDMSENEATDFLFAAVSRENYVPATAQTHTSFPRWRTRAAVARGAAATPDSTPRRFPAPDR